MTNYGTPIGGANFVTLVLLHILSELELQIGCYDVRDKFPEKVFQKTSSDNWTLLPGTRNKIRKEFDEKHGNDLKGWDIRILDLSKSPMESNGTKIKAPRNAFTLLYPIGDLFGPGIENARGRVCMSKEYIEIPMMAGLSLLLGVEERSLDYVTVYPENKMMLLVIAAPKKEI